MAKKEGAMVLEVGQILRSICGTKFFAEMGNSCTAPEQTNHLVKSLVWHSVMIAYYRDVDIYIDAFPRNEAQINWFFLSSPISSYTIGLKIINLVVDDDTLSQRVQARRVSDSDERLLSERLKVDKKVYEDNLDYIKNHRLRKTIVEDVPWT
jgi:adenylate kinase family enzyme